MSQLHEDIAATGVVIAFPIVLFESLPSSSGLTPKERNGSGGSTRLHYFLCWRSGFLVLLHAPKKRFHFFELHGIATASTSRANLLRIGS